MTGEPRIDHDPVRTPSHHRQLPPAVMEMHEKSHFQAAANRARRLYPGPAGEILAREIENWKEFGYRLSDNGLIRQFIAQVMKAPLPQACTCEGGER